MSATEASAKWINLCAPDINISGFMTIPTGRDRHNYIVVDRWFLSRRINSIYKYNIDSNKWNKIDGLNNIQNIAQCSAALDVKKQILFLFHGDSVSEIQLNNNNINNINNYTHSTT
eukprot:155945_1